MGVVGEVVVADLVPGTRHCADWTATDLEFGGDGERRNRRWMMIAVVTEIVVFVRGCCSGKRE